jgi:peptide/nickel transport system substrate-binding protein
MDSATFLPTDAAYRPAWSGYRYDPARARSLLEQAGCRRGDDGTYSCRGERLRLRIATTSGSPTREEVVGLVSRQLGRIGIEVDPRYVARDAFFTRYLPDGDFDAALFTWVAFGGLAPPEAKCGDWQNWIGFCDSRISGTAKLADRTTGPARRARVLSELDVLLAREVPLLPIVQPVFRAVMRDWVRGIYRGGSQFEFAQDSENWWLDD